MSTATNAPEATLESTPKAGQIVEHKGTRYNTIKEGLAHILVPPGAKTITDPKASKLDSGESAQNVFYNPIQQFNRDLSVLAIRAFSEDFEARRLQRAQDHNGRRREQLQRKKQKQRERQERKAAAASEATKQPSDDSKVPHDGAPAQEVLAVKSTAVVAGEQDSATLNGLKRKPHDEGNQVPDAKKLRLAADEGSDTVGTPQTTEALPMAEAPTKVLDPAMASALPAGERPDDKLRPHIRILDALSATGLRALRYASELPLPTQVVANDLLPSATAAIKVNASHNKLSHAITATTSNAQAHMYSAAFAYSEHAYGKYDVIDLDPYGTAVPFIESALLALNTPGLLCVTCTDAGVFNSVGYLEKSYALYGGIPIKGGHAHEGGLRLILHSIATTAAKHGMTIEPLLSLSIDFYARVFVRVRQAPVEVKHLASKTVVVHSCDHGCGAWNTQPIARASSREDRAGGTFFKFHPALTAGDKLCEHCGSKTHLAGPMWGGPLHNPFFVERILRYLPELDTSVYQTTERIEGMLSTALEELEVVAGLSEASLTTPARVNKTQKPSASTAAQDKSNGKVSTGTDGPSATATADAPQDPIKGNGPPGSNSEQAPSPIPSLKGLIPSIPAHIFDPHPFYFQPAALSGIIKCQAPPEAAIRGALRHMGYITTRTHAKPGMIKTQAPWSVIWSVMRGWVRRKANAKEGNPREGSAGYKILYPNGRDAVTEAGEGSDNNVEKMDVDGKGHEGEASAEAKIVFDEVLGKDRPGKKLMRYQLNPRANWGPMSRAKG